MPAGQVLDHMDQRTLEVRQQEPEQFKKARIAEGDHRTAAGDSGGPRKFVAGA
jgi:hypothetical protein